VNTCPGREWLRDCVLGSGCESRLAKQKGNVSRSCPSSFQGQHKVWRLAGRLAAWLIRGRAPLGAHSSDQRAVASGQSPGHDLMARGASGTSACCSGCCSASLLPTVICSRYLDFFRFLDISSPPPLLSLLSLLISPSPSPYHFNLRLRRDETSGDSVRDHTVSSRLVSPSLMSRSCSCS